MDGWIDRQQRWKWRDARWMLEMQIDKDSEREREMNRELSEQ